MSTLTKKNKNEQTFSLKTELAQAFLPASTSKKELRILDRRFLESFHNFEVAILKLSKTEGPQYSTENA